MAVSVKVGQVTLPTTTGDFAVTGVGFQPKAVLVWGHNRTADGYGAQFRRWIGCFTGTSQQWSVATGDDDNAATMNAGRYPIAGRSLLSVGSGTPGVDSEATLVSFDADGFTLNFSNAPASAFLLNYLALGGTDITNVKAGSFTPSAGTGNKATTDPGFQPDAVLLVSQGTADGAGAAHAVMSVGGFDRDLNEWASAYRSEDAAADANVAQVQRSDRCVLVLDESTAAYDGEFEAVSMDTSGFTINAITAMAQPIYYLAVKGGAHRFGVDTQKTSTGTKDTTTTGVNPLAALLVSANAASSSSIDSTLCKSSMGAGDGTTEGSVWGQSDDAAATSNTNQRQISTKAIGMSTSNSTTNAEADLSIITGGFRLDWTTADGTAREFCYWAIGTAAAHVVAVGQAAATATAQAISAAKRAALGIVSATAAAQPVTRAGQIVAVGQASASASAQTIAQKPLRRLVGQAVATSVALAMTPVRRYALGLATAAASAQPVTPRKARALGLASATAAAQSVTWAPKKRAVGIASATASAQSVTVALSGGWVAPTLAIGVVR